MKKNHGGIWWLCCTGKVSMQIFLHHLLTSSLLPLIMFVFTHQYSLHVCIKTCKTILTSVSICFYLELKMDHLESKSWQKCRWACLASLSYCDLLTLASGSLQMTFLEQQAWMLIAAELRATSTLGQVWSGSTVAVSCWVSVSQRLWSGNLEQISRILSQIIWQHCLCQLTFYPKGSTSPKVLQLTIMHVVLRVNLRNVLLNCL